MLQVLSFSTTSACFFFYKYGLSIKILIAESPRSFSIPLITCRVTSLTVGNTRNYTQGGNTIS
jgi:hypothetical protein